MKADERLDLQMTENFHHDNSGPVHSARADTYRAALVRACRALVAGGRAGWCSGCHYISGRDEDHTPDCDAEWARQVLDVLEVEE